MKYFLTFYFLTISVLLFAQQSDVTILRFTSLHTSFPEAARDSGHTYKNVLYDAAKHYSDSSVMVIVPKKLDAKKSVDIIFWFHGWGNNIDTAAVQFALIKQLAASKVNAVLALAETAKDAPDSYGGKLEHQNTFKELVNDILNKLKKEKSIAKNCKAANIILAGHSGAYRVMANILQNGNTPVQEVILFDALYAETDKFLTWIQQDKSHCFIDIYTDSGGTDIESKNMVKRLYAINISADTAQENDLTVQQLKAQPIIFIHSLHKHNDIIANPDNFRTFLENTTFLKKIRE